MARMNPASPEATVISQELNETPPVEQRTPDSKVEKTDGPVRDEKTGAYLPAKYPTTKGNTRVDR